MITLLLLSFIALGHVMDYLGMRESSLGSHSSPTPETDRARLPRNGTARLAHLHFGPSRVANSIASAWLVTQNRLELSQQQKGQPTSPRAHRRPAALRRKWTGSADHRKAATTRDSSPDSLPYPCSPCSLPKLPSKRSRSTRPLSRGPSRQKTSWAKRLTSPPGVWSAPRHAPVFFHLLLKCPRQRQIAGLKTFDGN